MKQLAQNLHRDTVLEFAARAIMNMHDLCNAARCLFENNFYGQARSTAITALEELGKFVLTLSYLSGELSEREFLQRVRSHHPKQRWGNLIAFFAPLTRRFMEQQGEISLGEGLFKQLDDRMASNLDGVVREMQEKESELEAFANYLVSGQVERERQDGWYVSLTVENETLHVSHPRMIDREKAESVLQLLSHFDHDIPGSSFDWTSLLGVSEDEIEKIPEDQMLEAFKRAIDQIANSKLMISSSEPVRTP